MTNIYDDQQFFDQYKEMPRSKNGLQGAGEWPTLATIFPNLHGQTVLDLGCGYGWHCRYAASQGAKKIIGVDLSEKMLEEARARTNDTTISYMQDDISTIRFAKDSFDFVFSSLAIHYVENWEQLVQHVHHFLKPNGQFFFQLNILFSQQMVGKTGFIQTTVRSCTFQLIIILTKGSVTQTS